VSKIIVTDDAVIIRDLEFANGLPTIDTGGRKLVFANNVIRNYEGVWDFKMGDESHIVGNLFVGKTTKSKKWWRFW
jgi:hypothetical protein